MIIFLTRVKKYKCTLCIKTHQRNYMGNLVPKAGKEFEVGTKDEPNGIRGGEKERERERERSEARTKIRGIRLKVF